jgi:hypothetical protein
MNITVVSQLDDQDKEYFVSSWADLPEWVKADLLKSGLSPEIVSEAKLFCPAWSERDLKPLLGFYPGRHQANQCYAFPYLIDGEPVSFVRVKLQHPMALKDGDKEAKYLSPKDSGCRLYVLPHDLQKTKSPKCQFFVIEGEKKTLKMAMELRQLEAESEHVRYCPIGIGGVGMWQSGDWRHFSLKNRVVYITFDADAVVNSQVCRQGLKLTLWLLSRGAAKVLALHWPLEEGKGIDDYLVGQEDPASALKNLIQNARNAIRHFGQNLSADTVIEIFAEAAIRHALQPHRFGDDLKQVLGIHKNKAIKAVKDRIKQLLLELRDKSIKNNKEILKKFFGVEVNQFPDDFGIVNGNLVKLDIRKEDIKICPICEFFIVSSILGDSENTFLKLKFISGKEITLPGHFVGDTRQLCKAFSDAEEILSATKAKLVASYITDFIQINKAVIPKTKLLKSTGWNSGGIFNLPSIKDNGVLWVDDERLIGFCIPDDKDEDDVFKRQVEKLIDVLRTRAGIVALASLASPLVYLCRCPNFVINVSGLTGTGKTSALRFATSLWGNPDDLMSTLNLTAVGFERLLDTLKDTFVWLDELESLNSRDFEKFIHIIYNFSEAKGRVRSNVFLTLRKCATFRGILGISMEHNLEAIISRLSNTRCKPLGLMRRVLEISAGDDFWKYFDDTQRVNLIHLNRFAQRYYGAFAVRWIDFVQSNKGVIIDEFERQEGCLTHLNGLESFLALVLTVLIFLRKMLNIGDLGVDLQGWILNNLIPEIQENISEARNLTDRVTKDLTSWILANQQFFLGLAGNETSPVWGVVKNNGEIFLTNQSLDRFCKEHGYVKRQIIQAFHRKGQLKCNLVGKLGSVRKINGRNVYGYTFYIPEFAYEAVDDVDVDFEESFENAKYLIEL